MDQAQYNEQYGEMLLDGLSSSSTYIPLRTNKRIGINVAIRPYVLRVSEGVVMFGGKLRVGYTLEGGEYITAKVTAISEEARFEQLKGFCKGFSWQKQSDRRFSTIVGLGFAASKYDGELARERMIEEGLAMQLLKRLESTYSQYNDGASFSAIRQAANALNDAWLLQSESSRVFQPIPEAVQLPTEVVGSQSGLLNKAQEKYHDNVVSFQDKVNAMKEEFIEDNESE